MQRQPTRGAARKPSRAQTEKALARLSERISRSFEKGLEVTEQAIRDFDAIAVRVLRDPLDGMPEAFDELAALASDYARNDLERDGDPKRALSYIRVYQTIRLIKRYDDERALERRLQDAPASDPLNGELLRLICLQPGISCKELSEELRVPQAEIRRRAAALEERYGCISTDIDGDGQGYALAARA